MVLFHMKITNYKFPPQPAISSICHSTIPFLRNLDNCEDNDFVIPTFKLFYFLDDIGQDYAKVVLGRDHSTKQNRFIALLENAARSFCGCTQAECIFMYKPQATVYVSFFWSEISEMNMFACGVQNKCPPS
jgi:hypothetical protein